MSLEMAAIAFVQMENGEYKYPEGSHRGNRNEDGTRSINKRELMRRAGYGAGSVDHYDDYLATQEEFWQLVELYRIRRTDPMFRQENADRLWTAIGETNSQLLYERLLYYPHTISVTDQVKIMQVMISGGKLLQKGSEANNTAKVDKLLGKLDPVARERAMRGWENRLKSELTKVEALKRAHTAADDE